MTEFRDEFSGGEMEKDYGGEGCVGGGYGAMRRENRGGESVENRNGLLNWCAALI